MKKPKNLYQSWAELKERAGGEVVAVRLGNWIEFFFDDAIKINSISPHLGLTERNGVVMCGLPISQVYTNQLEMFAKELAAKRYWAKKKIYLFEHSSDLQLVLNWEIVNIFGN